jgi:hypothetical protein
VKWDDVTAHEKQKVKKTAGNYEIRSMRREITRPRPPPPGQAGENRPYLA